MMRPYYLLVVSCSLVTVCPASDETEERVKAACQKIGELPLNSELHGADMWGDLIDRALPLFLDMARGCQDDPLDAMKHYIKTVLERPPEEAFRLLLAAEPVLLPLRGAHYNAPNDSLRQMQIAAAKIEIEMMKDPENRARLYRMVVWRGHYVGKDFLFQSSMDIGPLTNTYKALVRSDDIWWHLRNFHFIAIATNRLDLLEQIDIANGAGRVNEWAGWFLRNRSRLRASPNGYNWYIDVTTPLKKISDEDDDFWNPPAFLQTPLTPFNDWPREGFPLPLSGSKMPSST